MVVDSSVWVEILAQGPLAARCSRAITSAPAVAIPTVVLFEVYRKIRARGSEDLALQFVASSSQYHILELNREVALLAGDLSLEHGLGTVDSLVLAHAHHRREKLLTLDNDFAGLPDADVLRK